MSDQAHEVNIKRQDFDHFWIHTNLAFLIRYWGTAAEALRGVATDPPSVAEFRDREYREAYPAAVIDGHLEHHHYSGVLLIYALFDEFMIVLTERLGAHRAAVVQPNDLRDRGVRRYKKFIHRVCEIDPQAVDIDWEFLQDFAVVRNAIIHANGNRSHLSSPQQLDQVVARRTPNLSFKHRVKLVVTEDYVMECFTAVRRAATALNELTAE